MTDLVKYEAARAALIEAVRVDEVMAIQKQAEAFAAYARQASDTELLDKCMEIKLRAERRAGELLIAMEQSGERAVAAAGRPSKEKPRDETRLPEQPKTLKELGISYDQSSRWQGIAKLPEQQFEARVEAAKKSAIASVEMTAADKQERKKERRQTRERELGARQTALPNQKFGVILADPEWEFEPYSRETGMDRAAANHYPTSPTDVIAARDVASIAADDCVLFLWATVPMLLHAAHVMASWGFAYKSHAVWVKDRIGTGHWFRNKHELLLVGTRGDIPAPAPGTQWQSVIEATVGEHSEKPEIFLEMIEEYYPTLPKIELNRIGPARIGWDAWGLEAEAAE